ncbi:MAG: AMP-binding protein [Burkholderiaceae bacterium]
MRASLPLLCPGPATSHDAVFAWRHGVAISRAQFLDDVAALAAALPDRAHMLNVCSDRYRFAVGLAAAIVRRQISLMPPSTHAETVRQLTASYPDIYCLTEFPQSDIDLPQVVYEEALAMRAPRFLQNAGDRAIPLVPADQTIAYVFTSGSTGVPTPHRKRWGSLVENVRSEADRLGMLHDKQTSGDGAHAALAIVATVPPQHMFGFESSVLLAWQSPAAMVAERPFFSADIVASLASIPCRRMLVTTPFHLRTLLAALSVEPAHSALALPAVDLVLCATAPLSQALAREAEQRFHAPISEIYGCTETGQIASRQPTVDARWHLLGDVTLTIEDGEAIASNGHVEQPTSLADVIELAPDFASSRRFELVGRIADLINIAGKRTSLDYLNVQLNAIEGVIDGAFFMPDDDASEHGFARDGVTRLIAMVVAPTLDAQRLTAALRARVDAVFLPRPIHFVDQLPRNATGKLTRAMLESFATKRGATTGSLRSASRNAGAPAAPDDQHAARR